ncbi:MAG: hypothetical protein GY730_11050, partial [bacterium]|nr:hypothetical protein [bacterium]
MENIWNLINNCLKDKLSGPGYNTFMSSSKPLSFEHNILNIEVPNMFSKEWFKEKCEPIIKDNFNESIYSNIIFNYSIKSDTNPDNEQLNIFH